MLSEALAFPLRDDRWLDTVLVGGVLSILGFLVVPTILVVELVYFGVPALAFAGSVVLTAVIGVMTENTLANPSDFLELGILGLFPLFSAITLVAVAAYLFPAALANFARSDDVIAAFHVRTIARAAFTADYFVAVVLAIVVSVVLGIVGGLLVYLLVGIFVLFYLRVVVSHLFGRGFARGLGAAPMGTGTDESTT